jgi:hypothetical protein
LGGELRAKQYVTTATLNSTFSAAADIPPSENASLVMTHTTESFTKAAMLTAAFSQLRALV